MKHTPGPWKVEEYQNYFEIWPDRKSGAVQIIAATHHWECEAWKNDDRANARLIAAAPELYDAIKRLFKHCAMVHTHWGDSSNKLEADAAISAALTAIAKAEGLQ